MDTDGQNLNRRYKLDMFGGLPKYYSHQKNQEVHEELVRHNTKETAFDRFFDNPSNQSGMYEVTSYIGTGVNPAPIPTEPEGDASSTFIIGDITKGQEYIALLFKESEEKADKQFRKDFISWYWHNDIWVNKSSSLIFNMFDLDKPFQCVTTNTKFKLRRKV